MERVIKEADDWRIEAVWAGALESRVDDTLAYLESLSEEDGEALLRYDPHREWIGLGLPDDAFGQYVAIVIPSGYERFILDQIARGIKPTIFKEVLDIMPCGEHGDCALINEMLGRTDYAMAVFVYRLLPKWIPYYVGAFVQPASPGEYNQHAFAASLLPLLRFHQVIRFINANNFRQIACHCRWCPFCICRRCSAAICMAEGR